MADKKMTAAEKNAAAQADAARGAKERKLLIGVGAVLAAVALFVGGYGVGNSANDDDSIIGSGRVIEEPEVPPGPLGDAPGRDGDRPPGPGRGFELPEGFEFPDDFEFPDAFEFKLPDGFEFPEGFEFPDGFEFRFPDDFEIPREGAGFGFGLECTGSDDQPGGFRCEFAFPDDFEFPDGFPFPGGPFSGETDRPDASPAPDEVPAGRGFLGVQVENSPDGITVIEVIPGTAADEFGMAVDDVIIAVDGVELRSTQDLAAVITRSGAGTEVTIIVIRDGHEEHLIVVLGSPPR